LFDKWDRLPAPRRWLIAKLLSQADVVAVQSSESMKIAQRALPQVPCRINLFGANTDALVPAFPRPIHRPLRILSLGRDMHRDWETVIAAVSGWDTCAARVGAPFMNRRVAKLAKNVEFVKPDIAQLRSLYDWADIVVVALKPNRHISGITVVTEAVLMGAPVVCTDVGGLRNYFSGEEIMYVPPGDPAAIRRAIKQLADNDALRWSLAKKAQERLLKADFSTRARARRMAEMSRELLTEREDAESIATQFQAAE
jgi:glycosyltransferase involved in cell wall biosynthesis